MTFTHKKIGTSTERESLLPVEMGLLLSLLVCIAFFLFMKGPQNRAAALKVNEKPSDRSGAPHLGINASLNGKRPFPDDNPWNQRIDDQPIDPNSGEIISAIGAEVKLHPDFGANWQGGPYGIPYIVVSGDTPKVPITFDYKNESDPGPYPLPPDAPIEGGPDGKGDRHVIVIDRDRWQLYELFDFHPKPEGYHAASGAVWDLSSNATRPKGWTSADAAGLPIFPGLVRYDEAAELKSIRHALRFTVKRTRRAYVHPARHYASKLRDSNLPPMGMRVRLKRSVDISGFPPQAQVILKALKEYGMILADNGSNWYLSGAADPRWDDRQIDTLKRVKGKDFEVVKMGEIVTE